MAAWAGIALALRAPGDDAMGSRLPTYLHPIAGRTLAWHVLRSLTAVRPRARQFFLAWLGPADPGLIGELPARLLVADTDADWWERAAARLDPETERLLLVDGAAAALSSSLNDLVQRNRELALVASNGKVLAVFVRREHVEAADPAHRDLDALADGLPRMEANAPEAFLVVDRQTLAQATGRIQDRLVRRVMDGGVTVMLPQTVLVDVDVVVGADSVIYPGVILEGQTRIGAETVIGPGCRIVDSRIGNGVELKGWNFIMNANIRNRAVLEPYVRRGFD